MIEVLRDVWRGGYRSVIKSVFLLVAASISATAQGLRVELGTAGSATTGWSPLIPTSESDGRGRIIFRPAMGAAADVTFWLGRIGIRADATFARTSLMHTEGRDPRVGTDIVAGTQLLSGTADLILPLVGRRSSYIWDRSFAYLALGGGSRWTRPPEGGACPIADESAGCGVFVQTNSGSFLLARGTQPVALAGLGARLALGTHGALRLEAGDRMFRSPFVRLVPDRGGSYRRGEAISTFAHEPYLHLGVQFIIGAGPRARAPTRLPLQHATATVSGDSSKRSAATTYVTSGEVADTLVPILTKQARKAAARVAPVMGVVSVDSVAPRAIGNDGIYDVVLDIPNVSVDEITLEVNNLQAHVSLEAKVAKLVQLSVGADATIERVYLGIKGIQAQAHLKVDLDNVATIVDRVLTTLDRNPEIVTGLLQTIDRTVETVGGVANTALQPGGVVSEAVQAVGSVANTALQPGGVVNEAVRTVGDVANSALAPTGVIAQTVQTVGGVANTALQPAGVVSQTLQTVGDVTNTTLAPGGVLDRTVQTVGGVANNALQPGGIVGPVVGTVNGTLQNLTAQGGLLSAQGLNELGLTVVRIVDGSGQILQRTLDRAGGVVSDSLVGSVLQLPTLGEATGAQGQVFRTVRDVTGAIVLVTLDAAGKVVGTQVLQSINSTGIAAPLSPTPPPVIPPPARQEESSQANSAEPTIMQQGAPALQRTATLGAGHDTLPPPKPKAGAAPSTASNENEDEPGVPRPLVLAATLNENGQTVQRVVEATGAIWERTIDPTSGRVLFRKAMGNVLRMAPLSQRVDASGSFVRLVRDESGATLELSFNAAGLLSRIRIVPLGTAAPVGPAPAQSPVQSPIQSPTPASQPATGAARAAGSTAAGEQSRRLPAQPDTTTQLLLGQSVNEQGQAVLRLVDIRGNVSERTLNAAGQLVVKRRLLNARLLPPIREYVDVTGQYLRIVRDSLGALIQLNFTADGKLTRLRVLHRPGDIASNAPDGSGAGIPLLGRTVNAAGQIVQRTAEATGKVIEQTFDIGGRVVQQRAIGDLLQLPALAAIAQPNGQLAVIARDPSGMLLEILMRAADRMILSVRPLDTVVSR